MKARRMMRQGYTIAESQEIDTRSLKRDGFLKPQIIELGADKRKLEIQDKAQ